MPARFLQMSDVAEELSVTVSQVYHMVRSGELPAIKVGGRGQWRIERDRLQQDLERKNAGKANWVRQKPPTRPDDEIGVTDSAPPGPVFCGRGHSHTDTRC